MIPTLQLGGAMRARYHAQAGGGSDPYFSSVTALLHFEGADGSTTFTDVTGKTWTSRNGAQIDTAQYKFGSSSGLFDGANDYIDTPNHAGFQFGTGDFTVEMWVRKNANQAYSRLIALGAYATSGNFQIEDNMGSLNVHLNNSFIGMGTATSVGSWQHLAVTRSGTTVRAFVDGVQTSYGNWTNGGNVNSTGALSVGSSNSGGEYFNGWIDDLRITKGVARYTANFTPPSAAFPDA